MNSHLGRRLDRAAVAISGLCAVHCLALPALVVVFPLLSGFAEDDAWFHQLLLFFIIPISVVALVLGFRRHRATIVLVLGTAGIAILTLVALHGHDILGITGERWATTAGGLTLAAGHIINMARSRRQETEVRQGTGS